MLEGILTWLQLLAPSDLLNLRLVQSQSNLVFVMYLVTFKRSWHFAMAFIFCELLAMFDLFGLFSELDHKWYGVIFYIAICLTWSMVIVSQIKRTNNNGLAFACSIMILFLMFMAWDSWANADIETYAYKNYANIIVCIHACIIASLYKPGAYIDDMVCKLRNYGISLLHAYIVRLVCYNFR